MQQQTENWHLDKRVPIALILTIAMQTSAAIWWASSVSERIGQVERAQDVIARRAEAVDGRQQEQAQRIAVLTEAVANTNRNLERLQSEIGTTNNLLRDFLTNRYRGGSE
jgi:hypothetical protein